MMPLKKFVFPKISENFLLLNTYGKTGKLFTYLFIFTASISLCFFILLGVFSWPMGDDFVLSLYKFSESPLQYIIRSYLSWDGRLFSYIIYSLLFYHFNLQPFLSPVIVVIFFLLCYYLVLISKSYTIKPKRNFIIIETTMMIWIVWLGGIKINAEAIYWYTGGVQYTIIPMLGFLWLYLIHTLLVNTNIFKHKIFSIPAFFIFSFFIGTGNQTFSPSAIVIVTVIFMVSEKKLSENKAAFAAFMFFILGTICMYVTPGNLSRANAEGVSSSMINLSFLQLVMNYFTVLKKFFLLSKNLIIIAIIGKLSISILTYIMGNTFPLIEVNPSSQEKSFFIKYRSMIFTFTFLIAALINILPFSLFPDSAAPRSSVFFRFFLLLFIWGAMDYSIILFIRKAESFYSIIKFSSLIICLSLGVAASIISVKYSVEGHKIKKQMNRRYDKLSNLTSGEKKSDILLDQIEGKAPPCYISLYWSDIKDDKNHIFNTSLAKRFGVKSISLDSDSKK